jgi:hypothetical protein
MRTRTVTAERRYTETNPSSPQIIADAIRLDAEANRYPMSAPAPISTLGSMTPGAFDPPPPIQGSAP